MAESSEMLRAIGQSVVLLTEGLTHMQAVLDKIHEAVADNKPPKKSPLLDKVDELVAAVRDSTEVCRDMPTRVRDAIHEELVGRHA